MGDTVVRGRRRATWAAWAGLALAAAVLLPARLAAGRPPTITLFVASDSHLGARGMSDLNRVIVDQMNALPGTEYPPGIGGRVEPPRGVLFTGDTTDTGDLGEFAEFERLFGLTGRDGLLRFPVFESIGNHDLNPDSPIKDKAKARHGGTDYSWDWDGVHFACLDMYPDAGTLEWLHRDLARVPRARPIVFFFHYSLEGPYSDFWEEAEKEAFARAIADRNVLAIFHGHEHRVGHYLWRGHPVFRSGSPRHSSHAFLVVRIEVLRLAVAAWDYDRRGWTQSWTVPVRR